MSKSSPFESVHERLGANFAEYDGWRLPSDFGDAAAESESLYSNCAAFDLCSFGKIIVKGRDSGALVDKLVTANTEKLADGKWIWSAVCDKGGRVVDIIRVCRAGGNYTLITSPVKCSKVVSLAADCMSEYGIGGVDVEDITAKTGMLGLYGPRAVEVLGNILPLDISELGPGEIMSKSFFMISVTIIRGSWAGVDGIELLCPVSAASLAAGAVAKYRDRENIVSAGADCLNAAMIEASLPVSITGSPLGENLSPIELGLKGLVDFNKEFVGRDAIIEVAEKGCERSLVGIKTDGKGNTHENLKIQYDDREIGFSSRISYSQAMGCCIGFAVVDSQFVGFGQEVQIVGDDVVAGGQIVKLPFDCPGASPVLNA